MFWRKQKAAIERFHPLHKALTLEKAFSVSLHRDDWEPVIRSLAGHDAEIRRRKWRLNGRVPAVLVPMLRILAADMPPHGTLSVTADLRGPRAPGKAGPQQSLPNRGPISRMQQWYVMDPWLRMRAELRDGSVLELSVTDRIRHRKYRKRNPRGKVKLKHKTKAVQMVQVTRRLAKDAPTRRPESPPPGRIAVQGKQGKRQTIRAKAKWQEPHEDEHVMARIMQVMTEPFRWTPPGSAPAQGHAGRRT
ncbi:hypothetical protein ACN3XK_55075 [Actinomadura welshii]